MSIFDLKGSTGSGNNWNYSDPNKDGFMEMIEGTVVEISNPQALNFATKQPECWPDGNPKRNLQLVIKGRSGKELSWTFMPKGLGGQACLAALDPQGTRAQVSIEEMLGKFIRVQTQTGNYNSSNPRPWWVTILGDGDAASVRRVIDLEKEPRGGMAQGSQLPQNNQPPVPQPQPPVPQPQAPAPQPVPVQVQYAQQQAAQALGYQTVPQNPPIQQQQPPAIQGDYMPSVYDEDIPF